MCVGPLQSEKEKLIMNNVEKAEASFKNKKKKTSQQRSTER